MCVSHTSPLCLYYFNNTVKICYIRVWRLLCTCTCIYGYCFDILQNKSNMHGKKGNRTILHKCTPPVRCLDFTCGNLLRYKIVCTFPIQCLVLRVVLTQSIKALQVALNKIMFLLYGGYGSVGLKRQGELLVQCELTR